MVKVAGDPKRALNASLSSYQTQGEVIPSPFPFDLQIPVFAYANGAFDQPGSARLCDISRTTAYQYIGLLEG
jgi:hypothetical protein